MDRVASLMEYAKGTIYNHFPHKEEIVLALANDAMRLRKRLFEEAVSGDRSTRSKLMTVGLACEYYTQHCSEEFLLEQWMRNANIWDKSSPERQQHIRECEASCMQIVAGLVRAALESGDLPPLQRLNPEEMVFGLWAITFGSQILTASSPSLPALGIANPTQSIRVHCCTLLNGYGWKPLQQIEDYLREVDILAKDFFVRFEQTRRGFE